LFEPKIWDLLTCAFAMSRQRLAIFFVHDELRRTPFVNGGGHTLSAIATDSRDAMYNLATAAAAVGRNKNAILRAIEAGKIPVSQDTSGEMQIDPADLHRIYPPLRTGDTQQQRLYQSPLLMPVGG
jgi:hypothetical protein